MMQYIKKLIVVYFSWGALFAAPLVTPLMVIVYPFWIRFSNPGLSGEILAWLMLATYPSFIILFFVVLLKRKWVHATAYLLPFFEIFFLTKFNVLMKSLIFFGFLAYSFPIQSFYSKCHLTEYHLNNDKYFIGMCERTTNQDIPGFYSERGLIVYDSGRLIRSRKAFSNRNWVLAFNKELQDYADDPFSTINYIGLNYYYANLD